MPDFDTTTFTSVREFRHATRLAMQEAHVALAGRQGMTQEEQAEGLQKAADALADATVLAAQAVEFAKTRDFAAHQEAKDGPPPVAHLYPDEFFAFAGEGEEGEEDTF